VYLFLLQEFDKGSVEFNTIPDATAEYLFDNPPHKPSFIGGVSPHAGSTVLLSDSDEICISVLGEGFRENLSVEELAFRLSVATYFGVNGHQIPNEDVGPAYISTLLGRPSTSFTVCAVPNYVQSGLQVIEAQIFITPESIYQYTWVIRLE
jgi:hypothetical protein